MATSSLSLSGIGSCCYLNNGIIIRTWKKNKFPSARLLNKTKPLSRLTSALQSKIFASKTSIELKEPVSTKIEGESLKKVNSYSFGTKSGVLVKVKVEKNREKFSITVYVSSLKLSNDEKCKLVMVWGVYRSDSSCFLPLDFENSSQDSETHTTETPFAKKSLTLGLEFDGKESPFYLSFRLKLEPNSVEILSHKDTNFVVPVGFTSGHPLPLGLSSSSSDDDNNGSWNFALFSRNAKNVVLCLFDDSKTDKPALELDLDPYVNRTGDVWHAKIEKTWGFTRYGYRCKDIEEEDDIVLDPYAKVIGRLSKNPSFDWGQDSSPKIPLEKLVVYRLNVKSFTQHKSSKLSSNVAGTFSGVSEKVNHLKTLGVNAILLEPISSFSDEGSYFPFHFFSPMDIYGSVNSMKEMVKKLHSEGIEVILEVVFTHTSDSEAFQGIDDSCYYLDSKRRNLNCNFPVVQELVLQSLRYWVTEFHVDGFCFVNASSLLKGVHGEKLSRPPLIESIAFDPILADTKLIADSWDPTMSSNEEEEVKFPHWKRFAEVNTRYCRNVRNFVRGNGVLSDLATRICGSGDVFTDGRGPAYSFNYIARNSGLSLVDLVSFSDCSVSELSWNCGEEGATNKKTVLQRRLKQIRNFLFILYVSLGVPVLNMGDECGVSTKGSVLLESRNGFDWNTLDSVFGLQITRFISFMNSIRGRRSDVFQRKEFLKPENIVWFGNDQTTPNWEDPSSKFLALEIKAETEEDEETERKQSNGDLFIGFNASDCNVNVTLPLLPEGSEWRRLVDTALPFPGFFSDKGEAIVVTEAETEMMMMKKELVVVYEMKSYSCTLFETFTTTA